MIRRLLPILCLILAPLLALRAQLPVPVALSVSVNTNGVVIAPSAFWAANSNLLSAASPPARGAVTNIAWNEGHFVVSGTNVSIAPVVTMTNEWLTDLNLTNDWEVQDANILNLDGIVTGVNGVESLFLDGGVTTLRGITNLGLITPAVHAGTAVTNQVLQLVDAAEGTVEFTTLSVTTPTQATNIARAYGLSAASPRFRPPVAMGWPAAYDFEAAELPTGEFAALIEPRSLVDSRIWTGPAWYVATNGSDTAAGTLEAPFRSIWKAIQVGNSNAAPYRVLVGAGQYRMTNSINGWPSGWPTPPVSALIEPSQPCAIIAHGGRVTHSATRDVASFPVAKDGTYTNCYAISNSEGTRRVINRLALDSYGKAVELANAADLAACNSTPDTWYQSGSALYLHRADGVAPTYANTGVFCNTYVASFLTCDKDLYVEGFDFEGGSSGAFHADPVSTRNVVVVDCGARWSGGSLSLISGFRIRRVSGLVYMTRCVAEANASDGLNFHDDGSAGMCVVTSQCVAIDNGRFDGTSNNGWTTHDSVKACDIGGDYGPHLAGASAHAIETTWSWMCGTRARRGTLNAGSGNSAFKVSNSGVMVLEHCQAYSESSGNFAIFVQGSAAQLTSLSSQIFVGGVTNESGTTYTVLRSEHPTVHPRSVPYAMVSPTATDDAEDGLRVGSQWVNGNQAFLLLDATPGAAVWRPLTPNVNVQIFTSSGTWTKPTWVTTGTETTTLVLLGAGGGGGGGARRASGTAAWGGGGGGGGGLSVVTLPTSSLGTTETVTIGTAGTAGAAGASDDSNGTSGGAGGATVFGVWRALGGGGGGGGTTTSGAAGSVGSGGIGGGSGGAGAASAVTVAAGTGSAGVAAGGGGGGGGVNTPDAFQAGGPGGTTTALAGISGVGGVVSGASPGTGSVSMYGWIPLVGGAGGGASGNTSSAQAGAAATGYGAGGGGGGASRNGYAAGAGGAGAPGYAVAITQR